MGLFLFDSFEIDDDEDDGDDDDATARSPLLSEADSTIIDA